MTFLSPFEQFQDEELEKPIEKMEADLVVECSHLILKLRDANSPSFFKMKKFMKGLLTCSNNEI